MPWKEQYVSHLFLWQVFIVCIIPIWLDAINSLSSSVFYKIMLFVLCEISSLNTLRLFIFNLYITQSLTWHHMPEYPQPWKPKISQETLLSIWNYLTLNNSECSEIFYINGIYYTLWQWKLKYRGWKIYCNMRNWYAKMYRCFWFSTESSWHRKLISYWNLVTVL